MINRTAAKINHCVVNGGSAGNNRRGRGAQFPVGYRVVKTNWHKSPPIRLKRLPRQTHSKLYIVHFRAHCIIRRRRIAEKDRPARYDFNRSIVVERVPPNLFLALSIQRLTLA